MFKLHNKQQLSGSIHSGHFMVSRLDDDDDENNDVGDDTSESERDNAQSVEIDVNNPESVADAAKNLDSAYRVESPSSKNELVTSWNDLDRPSKRVQKQHQYLTYYTNTSSTYKHPTSDVSTSSMAPSNAGTNCRDDDLISAVPMDARIIRGGNIITLANGTTTNSTTSQDNVGTIISNVYPTSSKHHDELSLVHLNQSVRSMSTNSSPTSVPTPISMCNNVVMAPPEYTNEKAVKRFCSDQILSINEQQLSQEDQVAVLQSTQMSVQQQLRGSTTCGHAHAVTIDTSLTKLLECMSLYYSSKLTSPKWKSFKGLKLRMKYKIRLNNLIWRAWFLQCIRGRRPPGCQFTAPAESEVHKKSETIVLEGKYWKRKEKAIVDEYKKWRIFHSRQKLHQPQCFRPVSF